MLRLVSGSHEPDQLAHPLMQECAHTSCMMLRRPQLSSPCLPLHAGCHTLGAQMICACSLYAHSRAEAWQEQRIGHCLRRRGHLLRGWAPDNTWLQGQQPQLQLPGSHWLPWTHPWQGLGLDSGRPSGPIRYRLQEGLAWVDLGVRHSSVRLDPLEIHAQGPSTHPFAHPSSACPTPICPRRVHHDPGSMAKRRFNICLCLRIPEDL